MAKIYPQAYYGDKILPFEQANLSIASSAVLYGLSIYTVFHLSKQGGELLAFRLPEHYRRLEDSAKIIGIDSFTEHWTYPQFVAASTELCGANELDGDAFVRVSVHIDELLPGTRSRGLHSLVSMFAYEATPIVPQDGVRLKTSLWRRIPDNAIPSRAKVNGAYVNSVLARQDAIDSGYDDCVFLDGSGHVCELSAANIFIVRDGKVITPDTHSDLLEGINRRSILQLAQDLGYQTQERSVDLTELYVADEVFICGTSAFIAPVREIDARTVGHQHPGPITSRLRDAYFNVLHGRDPKYESWLTKIEVKV